MTPRPELLPHPPPPPPPPHLRRLPAIWFLGLSSFARLTLTMQVLGLRAPPHQSLLWPHRPWQPECHPQQDLISVYVDPSRSSVIPFRPPSAMPVTAVANLTEPPLNRWLQTGRAAPSSPRPPLTIQPLYMSLWRPEPQLAGVDKEHSKPAPGTDVSERSTHKAGMTQQVQTSKTYWEVLEAYWKSAMSVACSGGKETDREKEF